MKSKEQDQNQANQARRQNLFGFIGGSRTMSREQEDNHCSKGDGREVGEEKEKGAGGWAW
jgi:hypothetical protein